MVAVNVFSALLKKIAKERYYHYLLKSHLTHTNILILSKPQQQKQRELL